MADTFDALSTSPQAFAFDLDGTIYLQGKLLPGVHRLLQYLDQNNFPYLFATNNSSVTGDAYIERLGKLGINVSREAILTSNDVTIACLKNMGYTRPYLLATPDVAADYQRNGLTATHDEPDCVLLTFDTTLTYDKLLDATHLIRRGLPYFATHPDHVCPTLNGPIPDCGSFITLLHTATGKTPTVFGKPEVSMADAISTRLGYPEHFIAFVGDRLYTDIRMANENSFIAVLTLTGEANIDDLARSPFTPDLTVETLEQLHQYLEGLSGGTVSSRSESE